MPVPFLSLWQVRDVFLADGDAMTLPTARLVALCGAVRARLPRVRRIASYCLPRNIRGKSDADVSQRARAAARARRSQFEQCAHLLH